MRLSQRLALGKFQNPFRLAKGDRQRIRGLELSANLVGGNPALAVRDGISDGEQKLLRQAGDLAEPADTGNPRVTVAINLGRRGLVQVEGFYGLAWRVAFDMDKRQDDVVGVCFPR